MTDASADAGELLWAPDPALAASSDLARFTTWLESRIGTRLPTYQDVWRWSVDEPAAFWDAIWDYFEVPGSKGPGPALERSGSGVYGARWFPGAQLNWAENVLGRLGDGEVVTSLSATRDEPTRLDREQLTAAVASVQGGLRELGIQPGDRVAAYLPNIAEALVLLLACAGLGAIFTSCPPEFGVRAVVDRLDQVQPKLVVAVDGYRHKGRAVDKRGDLDATVAQLPSLEAVVLLGYLDPDATAPGWLRWRDLCRPGAELRFEPLGFDHPLYILYSSGTTGRPKAIVHGHGGVLLEHLKLHLLHHGLTAADRFFWYSTTGWVMWNYLVSGLLAGSAVVLFDGDPGYPSLDVLWELAERERITVFGGSATHLTSCQAAGLNPGRDHALPALRQLGSTGSPLPASVARWVCEQFGPGVALVSASGGSDVATAFCAGAPNVPFYAGEISCACLGVALEVFDADGTSVVEEPGELVVTAPMPSMPVGFWGEDGEARYRAAYFDTFPDVWAHGDLAVVSRRHTYRILGRSDATLNRGGVRLGTGDFYAVLAEVECIDDSLVIHLESAVGGAGVLLLFVVATAGAGAGDELLQRIVQRLRSSLSPRHVPDAVLWVGAIPRTLSGKRVEVPVKRILQGAPAGEVLARETLAQPAALDEVVDAARGYLAAANPAGVGWS